jgi:hypothetical protein
MKYSEIYDKRWSDDPNAGQALISNLPFAERLAWELLVDITDRRGWRHEWGRFDDDVKDEVFATHVGIIEKLSVAALDKMFTVDESILDTSTEFEGLKVLARRVVGRYLELLKDSILKPCEPTDGSTGALHAQV